MRAVAGPGCGGGHLLGEGSGGGIMGLAFRERVASDVFLSEPVLQT